MGSQNLEKFVLKTDISDITEKNDFIAENLRVDKNLKKTALKTDIADITEKNDIIAENIRVDKNLEKFVLKPDIAEKMILLPKICELIKI